MAKISNPVRFSAHFGIDEKVLAKRGVLNPTLNVDTKLFIDPFLIPLSAHPEMAKGGRKTYERHFETVIKLLAGSKQLGDTAWRNARRMMEFPEIKWTCLGYGGQSVSGSGSGAFTTNGVMQTAREIVDLGVDDPDLFVAMGLFEDGIGPDRISDMATNVILPDLLAFNARVLKGLKVPTKKLSLNLKNGSSYEAELPINPFEKGAGPIILVPSDVLRDLPIATDWSDVADAASKNAALRNKVNQQVAEIWGRKTRKDKSNLRGWAMSSQDNFKLYMELLRGAKPKPYDMAGDPLGELVWRRIAETLASDQPFKLAAPKKHDAASVAAVVSEIIEQFQFLIEKRRLSEELYHQSSPRPEKAAQRMFFAVAHAYCKANDLDLTPEAETGNGPVDFKMSSGFKGRVLVEIKLSTNPKVVAGYGKQLETYKGAEETTRGFYVVIDVGHIGNKAKELLAVKNAQVKAGKPSSEIVFIDGIRRASASKL
ncbi:hypothetical protein [Hyphomicrobium sulfonivorans]|uniref:hypothetical protein n=1 Tax=Hyphomicrobium sulfonivorans TaxID=121290 RepID=UPI0015705B34|nr:hypothetical protein [Hyphomicrobium sulfonivorans]MBI1650199.1 hypothetical protein [Hyphomicrobium sulfonivorans]NSL73115.1 hypothetical protein [Hyphomicrobium sulfonivorans]